MTREKMIDDAVRSIRERRPGSFRVAARRGYIYQSFADLVRSEFRWLQAQ